MIGHLQIASKSQHVSVQTQDLPSAHRPSQTKKYEKKKKRKKNVLLRLSFSKHPSTSSLIISSTTATPTPQKQLLSDQLSQLNSHAGQNFLL
jgi:hypothetical protein